MKLVTYNSTPGLEQFPESEHFRVYRSAYKKLMHQDAGFRQRVNRFKSSVFLTSSLVCLLTASPSFIIGRGVFPTVIGIAIIIGSAVVYTVYVLRASIKVQGFQNERIGKVLRDHAVQQERCI